MKGSFQIAKFAGIPVKIHWTFFFLLVWVIFEGRRHGLDWTGVSWFGVFVLMLFTCVLLHEFGHALSARRYGVTTKDIILSPIGGVARLDHLPEKPFHEFVVAIAGPLVNISIAGVVGGVGWESEMLRIPTPSSIAAFGNPENFITLLFFINIVLAVFNLVPAFPMDGGRIFRSLLAIKLGRRKATQIASYFGRGLALIFIALGLLSFVDTASDINPSFSNPMFLFIGFFIFYMASQEYQMVKFEDALEKNKVRDIMRSTFSKIQKSDPISVAIDAVKRGFEKDFIVFDEFEQVSGVLHEEVILQAAKKKNFEDLVVKFMKPEYELTHPEDSLKSFYLKMHKNKINILPVFEEEKLVGVLDIRQLNEFLRLQQKI